jgi:hypothetical protein
VILCRLGFHREYLEEAFGDDPKDNIVYAVRCGRCERRRLSINGASPKVPPHPASGRKLGNTLAARQWLAEREGSVARFATIWWM